MRVARVTATAIRCQTVPECWTAKSSEPSGHRSRRGHAGCTSGELPKDDLGITCPESRKTGGGDSQTDTDLVAGSQRSGSTTGSLRSG